jgi:raffinose/stachyose/melibiose transport system substrate-binding protein
MKKNSIRKILTCSMTGVMLAGLLAGCGSGTAASTSASSAPAANTAASASNAEASTAAESGDALVEAAKTEWDKDPVNLTMWYLSTRSNAQAVVDAWNAANPKIQVTLSSYDTDGIKDACKTAAQSKSLPSMWFNWGGSLGQYYVDNGLTYDLTNYAKENNWESKFNPGALSLVTLGGKISGYPTSFNVIGMFYRTDIFNQYGIAVPKTMDEFDQACATLKKNGITPITTGGLNGWHPMRLIEQFIESYAGADHHDELQALSASWVDDAVIKGLAKYQDYCKNGYFPDGFVTASPDDTKMGFETGTCAMDIQGQWYDGTLNSDSFPLDNVGWFPFPNGTGRMSAFAEMTQFNANLSDDELQAAILFNDFFFGAAATTVYPNDYNLPIPYAGNELSEKDQTIQPHVMDMLNTAGKDGTFTITDQALPSECADVLFAGQDAIAEGSSTPEEVAANVQKSIEAYQAK